MAATDGQRLADADVHLAVVAGVEPAAVQGVIEIVDTAHLGVLPASCLPGVGFSLGAGEACQTELGIALGKELFGLKDRERVDNLRVDAVCAVARPTYTTESQKNSQNCISIKHAAKIPTLHVSAH